MDLRLLRYFVAVAEERHFGRAATRLRMTQPSLSRAVKQLERDLGALLLERSPSWVRPTPAGAALYDEARMLLEQAEHARARVATAAGEATLTIGTFGEPIGGPVVTAFRRRHPGVAVHVRESDFTDPTTGLRTGLVDVALTRAPFDDEGIGTVVLRSDPIGVVLRAEDALASRDAVLLEDLHDRRWFRFPEGTDPLWSDYWTGGRDARRDGPVVRTAHECLQAVLWNGTVGLIPLGHEVPEGLVVVEIVDQPPSEQVIAWNEHDAGPLTRSFVAVATALHGPVTGQGAGPAGR